MVFQYFNYVTMIMTNFMGFDMDFSTSIEILNFFWFLIF